MTRNSQTAACGWAIPRPLASFTFCVLAIAISLARLAAAAEPGMQTTADRLVSSALRAEAQGDAAARATALRGAVQIAPDNKLARWHLGQIEIAGKWLDVSAAQMAAANDPRLQQYIELRGNYGNDFDSHLALARWCDKRGLTDEARFHWVSALSFQPKNDEALRALGVQPYHGRLLTPDQIASAKADGRSLEQAARDAKLRIARWQRPTDLDVSERAQALNEIRSIRSPGAIAVVESVTLGGTTETDDQAAKQRQLSMAFLDALDSMPDFAAIESLVRHAVLSPLPSVRASAIDRLKKRPLQDFVPLMLDGLAMPIESKFTVAADKFGSVQYNHQLYRHGPFADVSWDATHNFLQGDQDGHRYFTSVRKGIFFQDQGPVMSDADMLASIDRTSRIKQRQFGESAARLEQTIAAINASTAQLNQQICSALVAATNQDFGSNAQDWWNWWQNYNEYYSGGSTPLFSYQYSDVYCYIQRPDSYSQQSCFAKGTPVWTKTGKRPIESLRAGDMVLAQNVDTGELNYKPVVGTTLRPPSPLIKLTVGEESVLTTLGHPFWVAGRGWQMAKELETGAVLHGLNKPRDIAALQSASEAEAYNLIVADFSTYFVGEHGILVHDNTPRRPTLATVPGQASR